MNEINGLLKILELVRRNVHREFPLQQLVLFLTVVEKPGVTMPELATMLDMPQGTVSRNIKTLSHYVVWQDGLAVPHGRNLLRTQTDEENRHSLAVYPTGRGEALASEIARLFADAQGENERVPARQRGDDVLAGIRHWPRHHLRNV